MVLNVQDEIINGTPKYNITPNGDGTSNIELANEVVSEGTILNRVLFNKIENVLSYLEPSYTLNEKTETFSGDVLPNSITQNWTARYENIGNEIEYKLTTYGGITPIVKIKTDPKYFYTNDGFATDYIAIYSWNSSSRSYSWDSNTNLNYAKTKTLIGSNAYHTTSNQNIYIIFDFIKKTKFNFDSYIGYSGGFDLQYSDDGESWTTLTHLAEGEITYSVNQYHRYYRIKFPQPTSSREMNIYYLCVNNIQIIANEVNYTLNNNISFIDNQRILIHVPDTDDIDSSLTNTLNGIEIDTFMSRNKYYELIYNQAQDKFIAEEVRNAN